VQATDRGNEAHFDLGVKVLPEGDHHRESVTEVRAAVKKCCFPFLPCLGVDVHKREIEKCINILVEKVEGHRKLI